MPNTQVPTYELSRAPIFWTLLPSQSPCSGVSIFLCGRRPNVLFQMITAKWLQWLSNMHQLSSSTTLDHNRAEHAAMVWDFCKAEGNQEVGSLSWVDIVGRKAWGGKHLIIPATHQGVRHLVHLKKLPRWSCFKRWRFNLWEPPPLVPWRAENMLRSRRVIGFS